jgi:uncharacterized protein DUF4232
MPDLEGRLRGEFRMLRERLDISSPDPAVVFGRQRSPFWLRRRLLLVLASAGLAVGGSAGLAIALTGSHSSTAPAVTTTLPAITTTIPKTTAPQALLLPGVVANCTAPGNAADNTSAEPMSIVIACADAGIRFQNLRWTSWTLSSAMGTGQLSENDCTPSCAQGTFHQYQTSVSLSNVLASINGPVFSVLKATFPTGGPNVEGSEQFSLPVPPAPTPTCSANELQGSVSGPGISGNFSDEDVQFTNVSSQACHMEGFPGFDLLNASGDSILNAGRGCPWAPPGWCATTADYINLPAHGGTASFSFAWQSTPAPNQTCSQSGSALITPPNAFDHLRVPLAIQVCGEPLNLGVGTVEYG